jgi:hypothetical protein
MWIAIIIFLFLGYKGLKLYGDLMAIKNGRYVQRKVNQAIWKQIRKRK